VRFFRASKLLLLLAALTASTVVTAAEDPDARAVKYRKAVLTVMGANFGPLVAMARGNRDFDPKVVALRAERMHQMTLMMEEAFKRDTSASSVETEALDKIWGNWDDFSSKIDAVQKATKALSRATSDEEAFKAAFSKTGGTCKNCHDNYRAD
jgi:cytochrome c556